MELGDALALLALVSFMIGILQLMLQLMKD
jgi:hypothetical protein